MDDAQPSAFAKFNANSEWQPVFIVQTNCDLFFYDTFPFMKCRQALPYKSSCSLMQTRLVYQSSSSSRSGTVPSLSLNVEKPPTQAAFSSKSSSSLSSNSAAAVPTVFALRSGTPNGVESNFFCVQSLSELSQFSRHLIQSTHDLVRKQFVTFACLNGATECVLMLHSEGLRVSETATGRITHRIAWKQIYSTNDDGAKLIEFNYDTDNKVRYHSSCFVVCHYV